MTPTGLAREVLTTYAEALNAGDPRKAADCFTADAVYLEPPDRQHHEGREELFAFFGGHEPDPPAMSLTLHHVAVDEEASLAFAEYTYQGRNTYHGIAAVHLRDGLISSWREYQYQSTLGFADFAGRSLPHE